MARTVERTRRLPAVGDLAQATPAAGILTALYTADQLRVAEVEVTICNQGADATVRLSHAVRGSPDEPKQYKLYDYPLEAGASKITAAIKLRASDVVRVQSSSGDVSFTVNGIEEDA